MNNKFIIFFLILFIHSLNAQENELKIVLIEAPMITQSSDTDGLGLGLISDIIMEACLSTGIKYNPVFYPFKRASNNFESEEIPFILDRPGSRAIVSGKDPESYKDVPCCLIQSAYYYYKPLWKSKKNYMKISDLENLRIGIPRGTFFKNKLKASGVLVEEFNNTEYATKMLVSGRIELLFQIDFVQNYIINRYFKKDSDKFGIIENMTPRGSLGIVYKTDDLKAGETALKFKKGLNKIVKNGKYMEILKRYYSPDSVPPYHVDFINSISAE